MTPHTHTHTHTHTHHHHHTAQSMRSKKGTSVHSIDRLAHARSIFTTYTVARPDSPASLSGTEDPQLVHGLRHSSLSCIPSTENHNVCRHHVCVYTMRLLFVLDSCLGAACCLRCVRLHKRTHKTPFPFCTKIHTLTLTHRPSAVLLLTHTHPPSVPPVSPVSVTKDIRAYIRT